MSIYASSLATGTKINRFDYEALPTRAVTALKKFFINVKKNIREIFIKL